jgi:hypothetical protein
MDVVQEDAFHMKKQLALVAAICLGLGSLAGPARADDPWFNKWDRDHDGHWTYGEFKKAHSDWWRHHKDERRMTDAELRAEFDRMAASHHGWVAPDDVRTWHHW